MIGYIEFENATKFGDLELDFYKNENEAYNTIVLAGENGCGKTAILEAIASFQRGSYLWHSSPVKKIVYFDEEGKCRTILRDEEAAKYVKPEGVTEEQWEIACEFTEQTFYEERFELWNEAPFDIRNQRLVFSEARSGFEVDLENYRSDYGEEYEKEGANYSAIVQLLIDLEEKDDKEYISYAKFNPQCTYEAYMSSNSHTARFKKAFESMFEDICYLGKDARRQENTIYFVKGEQQIDINELSTGEKQIVFRGTDLLYHATNGATIIIDEPELSLHPKWQKKILDFYRNLFTDEKGEQIAQLIVATHSQYVIQSAMADRDNVKIVILEREGSKIKANAIEKAILEPYSSAEVNYLAFGMDKMEYHIQLFATLHNTLQDITGGQVDKTLSSIDKYIKNHSCYDSSKHEREDRLYHHYYTLPTYIRNAIDHPNEGRTYNDNDFEISIQLLRDIYMRVKRLQSENVLP
ncbi:MAG: AAA family ATPase [Anaerovoracaceae bacterium]